MFVHERILKQGKLHKSLQVISGNRYLVLFKLLIPWRFGVCYHRF